MGQCEGWVLVIGGEAQRSRRDLARTDAMGDILREAATSAAPRQSA
jgi:hypothetical protein